MKKIISKMFNFLKFILMFIAFALIFIGILFTYKRLDKSLTDAINIFIPFALVFILTVVNIIYKIIELKRLKYLIYVFLFTVLLSPLVLTWLKGYNDGRVYDMMFSPIETIEKENSAGTRAGLWFVSVEAMKDYPLTGYGWGYF